MVSKHLYGVAKTCLQVGTSMAFGDVVCQLLEKKDTLSSGTGVLNQINTDRTFRMAFTGFCVTGPWSYTQYQVFEYLSPGNSGKAVVKKILMSSTCAFLSISLVFSSVLLLQNRSNEITKKISTDLWPTWTTGAFYWPAVNAVNFYSVPLTHRPLVGALAGSAWNVYMAYKANIVTPDLHQLQDLDCSQGAGVRADPPVTVAL